VDETVDLFPSEQPSDWNLNWPQVTTSPGDVLVAPEQIFASSNVVVDDAALMQSGLDAAALVPDELGILYNVAGQWVQIPVEVYALQLYPSIGPNGGPEVRGPDNQIVLTEMQIANAGSDADLQTKTLQELSARSGLTQPSGEAPVDRPASLTQPAKQTTVSGTLDQAKVAEAITKSFANIITVIRQVANGTYRPGVNSPYGPTSPYGTLRPPQPGVPVRNVDGSVTVNNGNGTQTTTLPNGQTVTTRTSAAATTFGGVSTNTLLLVGAGLAAALLLKRK
jgi:hypothetical protein